jgi:hypothetical protein
VDRETTSFAYLPWLISIGVAGYIWLQIQSINNQFIEITPIREEIRRNPLGLHSTVIRSLGGGWFLVEQGSGFSTGGCANATY